ncbi:MAG TPA: peroxide stress protein YaaA [Marmoricola sp.]|nr:peroxide stress protein YaaA [Marmoricola sp.]
MLILLPPSEGKAIGRRGKPLDLASLSFPELTDARTEILDALIALCGTPDGSTPIQNEVITEQAAAILGIGHTQLDQVVLNARLRTAPTLRADRLYTGVLYDALDLASLPSDARRRATRWVAVTSSLFGLVRLGDSLPSYRLPGGTTLPGLGSVSSHWRAHLGPAMEDAIGKGLFVDLRSSTYTAFWRPTPELASRTATVRVLHEVKGQRKVVSHFNKATKGRLVRSLVSDATTPKSPIALADHLADLGWTVEIGKPTKTGVPLDVIVAEL